MKLLWEQCEDTSMLHNFINNHRYVNKQNLYLERDQKEINALTIFPFCGGTTDYPFSFYYCRFFSFLTCSLTCTAFVMEIILLQ